MLRLLSDEDVPASIALGLRKRHPGLDVLRVQQVGLRTKPNSEVLEWAAKHGRQVYTRDRKSMTATAWNRVQLGLEMPGLFVLPEGVRVGAAVEELELIALASDPKDWRDQVIFLPL
jgi:Domain of unknown function (DUF5615)